MRISRLVLAAIVIPALMAAAPADAATRKRPAVVKKAPATKVEKAPVPEGSMLPNLGPCQMTMLVYVAKFGGVYRICA